MTNKIFTESHQQPYSPVSKKTTIDDIPLDVLKIILSYLSEMKAAFGVNIQWKKAVTAIKTPEVMVVKSFFTSLSKTIGEKLEPAQRLSKLANDTLILKALLAQSSMMKLTETLSNCLKDPKLNLESLESLCQNSRPKHFANLFVIVRIDREIDNVYKLHKTNETYSLSLGLYGVAKECIQNNLLDKALEITERISEKSYKSQAQESIVSEYIKNKLFNKALEATEKLFEESWRKALFYREITKGCIQNNLLDNLLEIVKKMSRENEKKSPIYEQIAEICIQNKLFDRAIQSVEMTDGDDEKKSRFYERIAEICIQNQFYDDALRAAKKIPCAYACGPMLKKVAKACIKNKFLYIALGAADRIPDDDYLKVKVLCKVAEAFLQNDLFTKATELFDRALEVAKKISESSRKRKSSIDGEVGNSFNNNPLMNPLKITGLSSEGNQSHIPSDEVDTSVKNLKTDKPKETAKNQPNKEIHFSPFHKSSIQSGNHTENPGFSSPKTFSKKPVIINNQADRSEGIKPLKWILKIFQWIKQKAIRIKTSLSFHQDELRKND